MLKFARHYFRGQQVYSSQIIYDYSCIFLIIHVEKNLNTNCHELSVDYSKIINDYSCIFMIIRVEKEKT